MTRFTFSILAMTALTLFAISSNASAQGIQVRVQPDGIQIGNGQGSIKLKQQGRPKVDTFVVPQQRPPQRGTVIYDPHRHNDHRNRYTNPHYRDPHYRDPHYSEPHSTHRYQSESYYVAPSDITYGGFSHVDELAIRLERLSNELCLDLYYNYSHNYGFRETYAEAYQILQVAKYIHAAEHHNDRDAIAAKLDGLDRLFHHVEDDVRGWSRRHHRQIGTLGIITKMEYVEDTLHHLMQDVGVRASDPVNEFAPSPDFENAPVPVDY